MWIKYYLNFQFLILNVLVFYRFKPNEGVIVIGATNFAEALDKYVYISNKYFPSDSCFIPVALSYFQYTVLLCVESFHVPKNTTNTQSINRLLTCFCVVFCVHICKGSYFEHAVQQINSNYFKYLFPVPLF